MVLYTCNYCFVKKYTLHKYLCHMEQCHQHEANFNILCGFNGCPKSYGTVKCLRQHLRRSHNEYFIGKTGNCSSTLLETTESNMDFSDELGNDDTNSNSDQNVIPDACITPTGLLNGLSNHLAIFVLKLQEQYALPREIKEHVVDDVGHLCKYLSEGCMNIIQNGVDVVPLRDYDIDLAVSSVRSEHKLRKFCKNNGFS